MWRRPSPIASAIPFRYGASSTPSSSGVGSALAGHERLGDAAPPRTPSARPGGSRRTGRPGARRRPPRPSSSAARASSISSVREVELAAVDRADRVRARADRPARGGQGPLAGGGLARRSVRAGRRVSVVEVHADASGAGGDSAASHDHVHAVALAEGAQPVEGRAGPGAAALGGVARWRPGAARAGRLRLRGARLLVRVGLGVLRASSRAAARRRRRAATPSDRGRVHIARSGGTSPIRKVMPMDSRRKVKTWRRRSRARARLPLGGARRTATPLRGVTIQRPLRSVCFSLRQELHPALEIVHARRAARAGGAPWGAGTPPT